jgi:rubrerythrin
MDFMSKTDENLKAAITNESLARNRYSYFAEMANKEGYRYIAKIFEEIAENEKYHAIEELKLLLGNRDTLSNLTESVNGEQYESEDMYPRFAAEAEVEGNRAATVLFKQIARIETQHHDRFKKLLEMVAAGNVFKRDVPIKWKCVICGYAHEGLEPPNRCPYCKRPREYYEPANLDV